MVAATKWISGQTLKDVLEEQVDLGTRATVGKLTHLHGPTTLASLQHIKRGIEDLINIELAAKLKPELEAALAQSIDQNHHALLKTLDEHFAPGVSSRIAELLAHTATLRGFLTSYQTDWDERFSNLHTYADLANFLKSRRHHLNTLVYAIADLAHGETKLSLDDLYYLAFDTIERSFIAGLTSLHQKLTMLAVFPDYRCQTDGRGLLDTDPRSETLLDDQYLDAERMAITTIESASTVEGTYDRRKITSVPELRHQLLAIETSYAPYDLAGQGFSDLRRFVEEVMAYAKDDYYLRIPDDAFNAILIRYQHVPWKRRVVYSPVAGHPLHGSYAAFSQHGTVFYSDLMMLLRFAYRVRDRLLERNRRYQIKSGFIFEDTLKSQLPALGFEVLEIKRIDRKEFDVVAKRAGVVYNFQCKNALLDRNLMETNLQQFVRNNRRVVGYFKRALVKEEGREELLRRP
ncbi:hypothetical protein VDQ60_19735 [Xanthomonas campestris pv. campestris]|nr:hypothetical protein [Xanthomonas campestris pv. campestris]